MERKKRNVESWECPEGAEEGRINHLNVYISKCTDLKNPTFEWPKYHFDDNVQNIGMILLYGFSDKSEGVH